ncbi:uncharacterized protein KIAA0895 [Aplysia californica]|uniref:Uncharacterized protein KIAA0895 n=1 Tax=Aplysia californica TaxID=6500 RepID=A0ABM0K3D6_APLCA|nr:uncharacterized protein KIAA0895 [Aplysia californica]
MFYRRYRHSISNMERAGHITGGLNGSAKCVTLVTVETLNNKDQSQSLSFPNDKPRKKKKKKSTSKHRKSLSEVITVPHGSMLRDTSSLSDSDVKKKEDSKVKKLPNILSPGRLEELATPPPRQLSLPVHLVMKSNEKKKKLPLLAAIKPENEKSEKERFMRANFNYNPYFVYRGCVDDDVMDKFRDPSDKYIPHAILIMEKAISYFGTYETFEEVTGGRILSKSQIYSLVKKYLKNEELEDEVTLNLSEDMLSRGSMTRSKGKAMLNVRCVNLRECWAEGLLRHELGTHYLRSCNTRYQPWHSWRVRRDLGMGPINPTEEGLASLHSVLFRDRPYLWRAALLYYTTFMASRLSFKELFMDIEKFVYNPNVRWDYCLRAKRGQEDTSRPGCFCKDQVYLDGALQLLKRRRVLDFHLLVRLGKISYEDVDRECVTEIAQLENTRIPWFMNDLTIYRRQLDHIAYTNGLTDDVLSSAE